MTAPTAYPLAWPPGWPRTKARTKGPYRTQLPGSLNNLRAELRLLCGDAPAKTLVLSSNATLGDTAPADPGVVAYVTWEGEQFAIPCDRWSLIEHNVQAIALTIEAMRAMERHGAKHMIKAMFRGFTALPAPDHVNWRRVLDLWGGAIKAEHVQAQWKHLAAKHHPDKGGSADRMAEINAARDAALKELGDA